TNPAADLVGIKLPRSTPKFLTPSEVRQLLDHVAQRRSRNRDRDLAMVLTFWQTGLRVSEVAPLRWRQLDLERRALTGVRLKGGDVVDVDLNGETIVVLLGLRARAGMPGDNIAMFARYDGEALTVRGIEALFETWKTELGWTRRLH